MVDVVIIGGGPAGISAGTILQKKGYKTCIVDYCVFPREKLCAGVLTDKSIRLIERIYDDFDFENINMKKVNKIELLYNCKSIGKYRINNAYSVINRAEFDNELLKYYISVGGVVYEDEKKYKIIYNKNIIILSNGKIIKYNYLIGADGINSRVRRYVDTNWNASILCFEKFIPNKSNEDTIKIDFGGILGGYSWRIPGKERIGVGLGEFYIRGMRRKSSKYRNFFNKQGIEEIDNIRGAFVSFGNYVKNPIRNNVILVGDAAGLVDAMTGEGIFFAIESGKYAALSIIDNYSLGYSLNIYINRIRKIHKRMKEQSLYNKLLYVPLIQKICMRHIRNNPVFVKNVMDNVISTYRTGYTYEILKNKKTN